MTRTNSSLFSLLYSSYASESIVGLGQHTDGWMCLFELWVYRIIIYVQGSLYLFCLYDKKKQKGKCSNSIPIYSVCLSVNRDISLIIYYIFTCMT